MKMRETRPDPASVTPQVQKVDAPNAGKTSADNEYFTGKTEYKAPDNGTGKTYTVHKQDIDPDAVVKTKTGKITTNRELMQNGNAPYVNKNGKWEQVQLHHSRQNADGSLFELSEKTHQVRTGQGAEALHPYKTKAGQANNGVGSGPTGNQHPTNPVNRPAFDTDREAYWTDRINKLDNGGNN